MTIKFKPFEKWILLILFFLLPTQLAYHFWPTSAFVFGIRVDYLAPTIYLTDILLVALLLMNLKVFRGYGWLFALVSALGLINTFFSAIPSASFIRWIKVLEVVALAVYIARQRTVQSDVIYKTLFYSAIFFSLIGVFQFVTGRTLGSLFYIFGERSFGLSTPGIALATVWGRQFLRAYSTFSHPNSLAGYLGVVLILCSKIKIKSKWFFVGLMIIVAGFILSFSLTALLAMVVVYVFFILSKNARLFKKLTLFLLAVVIFFSTTLPVSAQVFSARVGALPSNIIQRLDLAIVSGKMIGQRFLVGEGLNTFILVATKIRSSVTYSWLMQPVHNIYLLVFSEIGIIGLLVFSFLFYKLLSRNLATKKTTLVLCFVFVMITGIADHYWVTLQQNLLLLFVLVGLSFRNTTHK